MKVRTYYSIEDMKELALKHGGACLSSVYKNTSTKLRWQCAEGHTWDALPNNVLRGHWCLICGNQRQGRSKANSLESAKTMARLNGGECLSENYTNNRSPMLWRCGVCSFEWKASAGSIQGGTWCPKCAGRLPSNEALLALKQLAKNKGGECLSEHYLGARTKHFWRCAKGHEWEAPPYSIRAGTWCMKCGGAERLSLSDIQETAQQFGGTCLSTKYTNSSQKLHWRCSAGHEWFAVAYHVRGGHWCPTCMAGNSERICKDLMERMFGQPFLKVKPEWLINDRGNRMELDGYCAELQIAFEFHGQQHYQHVGHFHQGNKTLEQRQLDDKNKESLCSEHGVRLLVIPHTVGFDALPHFIAEFAKLNHIPLRCDDVDKLNATNVVLPEMLEKMRALARTKGGQCLSEDYVNNNTHLTWQCDKGHTWEAVPGSVQQGSWCPKCAGRLKGEEALENLREIARSKGGACLADSYSHGKIKLSWRCAEGHVWTSSANNIRGGSWCHECAKKTMGPRVSKMQGKTKLGEAT